MAAGGRTLQAQTRFESKEKNSLHKQFWLKIQIID